MSLIVALCIIFSIAFTVVGSVYDWLDKSRLALSDVCLGMIGMMVSISFVMKLLLWGG